MSTTLERLGGERTVSAVVTRFYAKALADPRLAGYFHGTNIELLRRHQTELFVAALTGDASRREPAESDNSLPGIHHDEYDLVIGYLADALRESSVEEDLLSGVLFVLAPLARDVTTVPAVPG
ncbi:group I truncated hemoglobin [Actinopolyspora mortivallis]|uniref:Group 1 truncated hemoglobin n=1 Tax=Actinopolyspora mortivallis TaxID=33906 RepID=A0A2T0H1K9_ACTMO|nr:group 1 truncated hemoglobin [Actinopolyspora mortivallis]PRW65259.1 group 1 truncated hemoglobin [Actinopolyspora mortivallis]